MTKKKSKYVTDDEALHFSIKDEELLVEDTDTKESVCLAIDVEGIDEVIKILESMKLLMTAGMDTVELQEEEEEEEEEEDDDTAENLEEEEEEEDE